jgi:hypothetical protein
LGAFAANPVWADEISGCVNKSTGALRIAAKCKKAETPLAFNAAGQQGPKGDTGPQGPKGDPGTGGDGGGIKVFDANGQFLGYRVGDLEIFISTAQAVTKLDQGGDSHGQIPEWKGSYYRATYAISAAPDCSGNDVFMASDSKLEPRIFRKDGKVYVVTARSPVKVDKLYEKYPNGSGSDGNGLGCRARAISLPTSR